MQLTPLDMTKHLSGLRYKLMKKNKQIIPQSSFTEFLLDTTPNGKVKVEIFLRDENIWLTQAKIAELFDVDRNVVTKHFQNIFFVGELDKDSTCAKIAQVQTEGQRQVNRKEKIMIYLNEDTSVPSFR